ncbi:MAG: type II secretion system F family protein, partial [Candidatus Omnitrophota bacterium]|nr:type II secretion system F family protein [Candidatus Omnitrophota bacterium]
MARFYYIARNRAGVKETGIEEALTQEDAVVKIQAKGLIVVNVIPEGSELFNDSSTGNSIKVRFKPKHGRITSEDLMLFCRQLATLIGAGVTILKSLEIISKQVASRKLYNVSMDLKKSMEAGLSFHEALAVHPKIFSGLWINLIESGEASGNLAVVLSRLATYLEKEAAFKNKVISALIYPAILTLVGVGALLFLSLKIVPAFAEIFKGFNITLPWLTQVLVNMSDFLKKKIMLLFLFSGAGIFIFQKY